MDEALGLELGHCLLTVDNEFYIMFQANRNDVRGSLTLGGGIVTSLLRMEVWTPPGPGNMNPPTDLADFGRSPSVFVAL